MGAVHAVVSGRVQGVFFRQTCRQLARRLGLVGWVRNRPHYYLYPGDTVCVP
jgi:acylphosphatase